MIHFPMSTTLLSMVVMTCAAVLSAPPVAAQDTQPAEPSTQAQSELPDAKTLIEQALSAMGSEQAMKEIKSLHTVAELVEGDRTMTVTTYWMSPDKAKFVQEVFISQINDTFRNVMVANSGIAWEHNSELGGQRVLTERDADGIVEQCRMHLTVQTEQERMKEDGTTVALTEFNGEQCYKIRVPLYVVAEQENHPADRHLFISKETRLPVGISMSMGANTASMYFDDWEELEGVKFYRKITMDRGGGQVAEMHYKEITLNSVDESEFEVPAEVQQKVEQRKAADREPHPNDHPQG